MSFPPAVTLVTFSGEFLELDGSPAAGRIVFTLTTPVEVVGDTATIIPSRYTATLDANGQFSIQLPATDDTDLTPVPFAYYVEPFLTSCQDPFWLSLPTSDLTVNWNDAITVPAMADPNTCGCVVTAGSNVTVTGSGTILDPYVVSSTGGGGGGGIPATILDAKGDIIAATAADTAARLPVGTNGQLLVADSSQSTGLRWRALLAADIPDISATYLTVVTAGTTYIARALVDAKGDIVTATANDTPARLAVGTDGQLLVADSSQSTGLRWRALLAADIPDLSGTYIARSLVDAKGDLITATADNTPARLAVGTDGQLLVADSSQSTGLRWRALLAADIPDLSATYLTVTTAGTTYIARALVDAKGDIITATADNTPARLAVGTNGQVLRANSSASTGLDWWTSQLYAEKTSADQSLNTSTTLVDITDLSVTVEANATYELDLWIIYDTGSTPDIKFGLSTPASSSGNWAGAPARNTADTALNLLAVSIASTLSSGGVAAGTVLAVRYTGLIKTTNTGTVKAQYAQDTSNATNTIIKTGSFLRLIRVA